VAEKQLSICTCLLKIHRGFIAGLLRCWVTGSWGTFGACQRKEEKPYGARHRRGLRASVLKINHPAPGDVVGNPAHVAGYGTAFEGTISLRIRDDDGTVIAEGYAQGGSNGVIDEFKTDLEIDRRPNRRPGVVEAFEESASGSGEDLHLDRVPIVFR
jgi:hypothetical protein